MSETQRPVIAVIDDEKNIRRTLRMVLEAEGHDVREAASAEEARRQLALEPRPKVALLDVKLGDDNGLELLTEIRASSLARGGIDADTPVVMISGHATIDDAVAATRGGAFDFLEKPLDRTRVVVTVRNALERRRMLEEVRTLQDAVDSRFTLIGHSAELDELRRQIAKVAPTKTRVLITGESGTGKELIARAVHRNSMVSGGPFVKVNCAAISPELIESELFGHEKGAFTGATATKRGLFEVAVDGTIFLDEIGDMSLTAQAKVLRVLQTGEFTRVGGEKTLTTNCRVVAATNKDLAAAVEDGSFREDLYFRLNVVPIVSPPLRDRSEDIPLLAEAFVAQCCEDNGLGHKDMGPGVSEKLKAYDWPGNVRELRNVVERMVIMSDDYLGEGDLPPDLGGRPPQRKETSNEGLDFASYEASTLREFREAVETAFIVHKLDMNDWNISRTAQILGIERTNLHKRMRTLGIHRKDRQ